MPAIVLLALGGFLSVTTETLPAGLLPQLAPGLGISIATAGLLTSAYAGAVVISVLNLTKWTLKVPRNMLVPALLLAFGLSNLAIAVSPSFGPAIIGRVVGGATHGLFWAICAPTLALIVPPRELARAMAIVSGANALGVAAGAPIGTLLGQTLGWRWAFAIVFMLSVLLAAGAALVIPRVVPHPHQARPLLEVARQPGVLKAAGGWGVLFIGHFAIFTFIAPLLLTKGVPSSAVGLGLTVLGLAGIPGILFAARLAPRYYRRGLLMAPVVTAIAFAVLGVIPAWPIPAVIAIAVWGASINSSMIFNNQAVLQVGHRARDTASSISVLITQLGIAIAGLLSSAAVATLGLSVLPWIGVVALLGSSLVMRSIRPIDLLPPVV